MDTNDKFIFACLMFCVSFGIVAVLTYSPMASNATNQGQACFGTISTAGGKIKAQFPNDTLRIFGGTSNPFLKSFTMVGPTNTPAVPHEWFNAYNAATGSFSQSQPAASDVSGLGPFATQSADGRAGAGVCWKTATVFGHYSTDGSCQ